MGDREEQRRELAILCLEQLAGGGITVAGDCAAPQPESCGDQVEVLHGDASIHMQGPVMPHGLLGQRAPDPGRKNDRHRRPFGKFGLK